MSLTTYVEGVKLLFVPYSVGSMIDIDNISTATDCVVSTNC
jgi:hypothetical protein